MEEGSSFRQAPHQWLC